MNRKPITPSVDDLVEYPTFPDVARRNLMQEHMEVPMLLAALQLPTEAEVLEVGCGRGVALPVLAARMRPKRLVALDICREFLAEARARARTRGFDVELRLEDIRACELPDASLDVVIDFGTCYHLDRPAAALHQIARILRPGGLFVHETKLSQFMSHPFLSYGRTLPWAEVPALEPYRPRVLWSARRKRGASS